MCDVCCNIYALFDSQLVCSCLAAPSILEYDASVAPLAIALTHPYSEMSSAISTSAQSTTFGCQGNWPVLVRSILEAISNEVGGDPSFFDVIEYLNPIKLKD
eukprot:1162889-Amphidinium_carterae.1